MSDNRHERQFGWAVAVIGPLLALLFIVSPRQPLSAAQITAAAIETTSKKIAYSIMPFDEIGVQISIMNSDGSNSQRLTDVPGSWSQDPSWSPDGKHVAFMSDRVNKTYQIYVIDADRSGQRPLTHFSGGALDLAWSPDGEYIAYDAPFDGHERIFVMNADGSDPHPLITDKTSDNQFPTWSPDSKQIAFSSFGDLDHNGVMAINLDGSALHLVYRATYRGIDCSTAPCAASVFKVNWSPDGKQIAFASDQETGVIDIFVVNSDGSAERRLINMTKEPSIDLRREDPAWSPDSKEIAFAMDVDRPLTDIFILDIASSTVRRLTYSNNKVNSFAPAWQP